MAVLEALSLATTILVLCVTTLALVHYMFQPLWLVAQGQAIVIERYGVFNREGTAGWCWVNPFVDRVRKVEWRFNVEDHTALGTPTTRMEVFASERIPVAGCVHLMVPFNCQTSDGAVLCVSLTQPYDIVSVKRAAYVKDLFLSLDAQLRSEIQAAVSALTREKCDAHTLEQTLRSRLGNLKWAAQNGLQLGPCSITNFQYTLDGDRVKSLSKKSAVSMQYEDECVATNDEDVTGHYPLRTAVIRAELSELKKASKENCLSDEVLIAYINQMAK